MKELSIANFKAGVDNRREALTSVLGTLVQCENAHINPGGEVEKRKAFYYIDGFTVEDSLNGPAFFWIESTDAGLVLFGSSLAFGSTPSQGQPINDAAPPVGYTYVQLAHPAVLEGETFDVDEHQMHSIRWSRVFDGKAYVAAKFVDGNTFLYYDGVLVDQSRDGRVLEGLEAPADLSTQLAEQVNRIVDWSAIANVDQNGATQNGTTMVKSPAETYYTPIPTVESDDGIIGADFVDQDVPITPEVKAVASFLVVRAADGTIDIEAPRIDSPTSVVLINITGGPVSTAATATLMAEKIVQAINDLTVVHGYTALSNAATVSVYAPIGYGAAMNVLSLSTTETGGMSTAAPGAVSPDLAVTASPDPASSIWQGTASSGGTRQLSIQIKVSASGGTGPYTYAWTNTTGLNAFGVNTSQVSLSKVLNKGESLDRVVTCTVTDSLAVVVVKNVSVHLEYKYP